MAKDQSNQKSGFCITGKEVFEAFKTSIPIMVTFIVLGTGYGLLLEKHGYGPVWALVSGLVIFSGTVQYVSVGLLSAGSFVMAAVTAIMISIRYIFLSISMIGRYKDEGKRKWYLFYALCDETYAMLSHDEVPEGVNVSGYRFLVTLFDQSSWVLGSFLGGWIGTLIRFDSTGIDFAMTALFLTVFIEQWMRSGSHIPAITGVLATLACRLLFGPDLFLIPSIVIILIVMTVMRKKIESGGESDA